MCESRLPGAINFYEAIALVLGGFPLVLIGLALILYSGNLGKARENVQHIP